MYPVHLRVSQLCLQLINGVPGQPTTASIDKNMMKKNMAHQECSGECRYGESKAYCQWYKVKLWLWTQFAVNSVQYGLLSENKALDGITELDIINDEQNKCLSDYVDKNDNQPQNEITNDILTSIIEHEDGQWTLINGIQALNIDASASSTPRIRETYDKLNVLGAGAFGSVVLSRTASSNSLYAVKMIEKEKLSNNYMAEEKKRILTERQVLIETSHPFIIKLESAFETQDHLNFVLEYCPGGDLYTLLENESNHFLNEHLVVFYSASILTALHYLHHHGIAYRDLKPENILLDKDGFIRLADFGLAKLGMENDSSTYSFCGSVDYMAPELLTGAGYGKSADLWSFGCVIFEMLTGLPPFYTTRGRRHLFDKILAGRVSYPSHMSADACHLVAGLLQYDPKLRLGNGPAGMAAIFEHPFFKAVDWYQLVIKQVPVPLVPKLNDPCDTSNFGNQFTSQVISGSIVDSRDKIHDDLEFIGFDWHQDDM